MEVLPDIVGDDPLVVFCGLAGADSTKTRDHYYETPGNNFWECLHLGGFTERQLHPTDDATLPSYRLGVTDLVGHWDPRWVEAEELVVKVERWAPEWLALTSKNVAHELSRALGVRWSGRLGAADWYVGEAQVFVLPGTSGANRRHDYDGRPQRLAWWRELAQLAGVA